MFSRKSFLLVNKQHVPQPRRARRGVASHNTIPVWWTPPGPLVQPEAHQTSHVGPTISNCHFLSLQPFSHQMAGAFAVCIHYVGGLSHSQQVPVGHFWVIVTLINWARLM